MKLTFNEAAIIELLLYRNEPYIPDIIRSYPPEYAEIVWKTISELHAKFHIPIKKERRQQIDRYVGGRYELNKEKIQQRQQYVNNKERR